MAQGVLIDPDLKDSWIRTFKAQSMPTLLPPLPTTEEVEQAAVALMEDIQSTNQLIFRRRCPFHPKAAPWWNATCAMAVQNLQGARDPATQATAHACLKGTIHVAK